jgi:hypothetical protein
MKWRTGQWSCVLLAVGLLYAGVVFWAMKSQPVINPGLKGDIQMTVVFAGFLVVPACGLVGLILGVIGERSNAGRVAIAGNGLLLVATGAFVLANCGGWGK